MKDIDVIIIEDEILAQKRLISLLKKEKDFNILKVCANGIEAQKYIIELKPDVVFLDIVLNDMTGFDVIEGVKKKFLPLTIVTSAFEEYAIKAFDIKAFDYLLKPYDDNRFYETLDKVRNYRQEQNVKEEVDLGIKLFQNRLTIKSGNKVYFVPYEEIKYIIAAGYYAEIFTSDDKKYLLRESLTSLITRINSMDFIRIHRSTIVNVNFIQELVHSNYGEFDIRIYDNKLFRISKGYKKEFQSLLGL